MFNHVRRDADARILDRDFDQYVARARVGQPRGADQDMPVLRKLNSISHQVGKHLPNAPCIADQLARQEQVVIQREVQPLLHRKGL